MRKSRFSGEQMVRIIREAEKGSIAEVAKKHGVSDQTIYLWRKRFGTMGVDDAKRLKTLEQENANPKKLLVDRLLEIEVLKDINTKNGERARSALAGGPSVQALEAAAPSGVHAPLRRSIQCAVCVEARGRRCARRQAYARARGAIPALRLPSHPHLPRTRRTSHERRPRAPPLAGVATSGAAPASSAAHSDRPASTHAAAAPAWVCGGSFGDYAVDRRVGDRLPVFEAVHLRRAIGLAVSVHRREGHRDDGAHVVEPNSLSIGPLADRLVIVRDGDVLG